MNVSTVTTGAKARFSTWQTIGLATLVIGVLDAINALIAFKAVLGLNGVKIYQFVASGILGKSAFAGGVNTALFGLAIHFLIAFAAAGAYWFASRRFPYLRTNWISCGLAFGVLVYVVMNYIVIPLSAIGPSSFSLPLFLNGVIGHAILVGLPAAFFARQSYPDNDSV